MELVRSLIIHIERALYLILESFFIECETTHRLPLMSGPTCSYGNRYMQHPGG